MRANASANPALRRFSWIYAGSLALKLLVLVLFLALAARLLGVS